MRACACAVFVCLGAIKRDRRILDVGSWEASVQDSQVLKGGLRQVKTTDVFGDVYHLSRDVAFVLYAHQDGANNTQFSVSYAH